MKILIVILILFFPFCASSQNWETVGTHKFNHEVDRLYSDTMSGQLYNTGMYWMIDTTAAYGLAQWNGTEWTSAFVDCNNNSQKRITNFQGDLYVSKSPFLFRWDGTTWDTVANMDNGSGGIFALYNDGDSVLFVMGIFNLVNSTPASYIARFDGVAWSRIDTTIWSGGAANCALRYQGHMYFGGGFYNTASAIYRITRWDGTNWNAVSGGITGSLGVANCMEEYNGDLYVGGNMEVSQGNPGDFIARWNGSTWSQVGGGMDGGQVLSMKVFNNALWAGGQFGYAGGVSATYVARYDGLDWCAVGVFDNAVLAFEVHNNELYVSGNFSTADGDSVNKVVKWIGGTFSDTCGHLNTGIPEQDEHFPASVFPNPCNELITFYFQQPDQSKTIRICDQLGREIWAERTDQNSITISVQEFADGIYYYSVVNEDLKIVSGKFLVNH